MLLSWISKNRWTYKDIAVKNIAPHLLTTAEHILGRELHPLRKDAEFVSAVATAYEAVGFGSTNAEILKRAEVVFAEMQANAVPSAEPELLLPTSTISVSEARAEAQSLGEKSGAIEERRRISAILSDPVAAKRMEAAKHLAFNTDMTPAEAIALLHTIQPFNTIPSVTDFQRNALRACNAPGGLVAYDDLAENVGAPETVDQQLMSATLCSVEATSDPYAAIRKTPEQNNKALWKRATDALNAETGHAIHI